MSVAILFASSACRSLHKYSRDWLIDTSSPMALDDLSKISSALASAICWASMPLGLRLPSLNGISTSLPKTLNKKNKLYQYQANLTLLSQERQRVNQYCNCPPPPIFMPFTGHAEYGHARCNMPEDKKLSSFQINWTKVLSISK